MIPLFKLIWHELWFHEDKARIWLRGFFAWAAMALAQVLAYPMSVVLNWTFKEWFARMGVASLAGFALLVRGGEKNIMPDDPVKP